jgi:hypothetical protein
MSKWRDVILEEFIPDIAKLTLVSDPDCLLVEEKMATELRNRGFDSLEYSDFSDFRYVYETKYRSHWDLGNETEQSVILRIEEMGFDSIPYDLQHTGRKLSFSLGELFPSINYLVLKNLNLEMLDLLYDAQEKLNPGHMGENSSIDFVFQHVYKLAIDLIVTDVELLILLLKIHYGKLVLPSLLQARLLKVLENSGSFGEWPLKEILSDSTYFYSFLQERWKFFLINTYSKKEKNDEVEKWKFIFKGPINIPFDHQNIRVYIDNLFAERKLNPVSITNINIEDHSWIWSGIQEKDSDNIDIRICSLFDEVDLEIDSTNFRHTDWVSFAIKWAELKALVIGNKKVQYKEKLVDQGENINIHFENWLRQHYSSIVNLPPSPPAMVHHIPRYLSRIIEDKEINKIALLVIDGLSLDQWVTVKSIMQSQNNNFSFSETATFAWVPTLTSVSRQSIFSGKLPLYFPASIYSTNSEKKLWFQFWQKHGYSKHEVAYKRGLGDGDIKSILDEVIIESQTKIAGLVVDKVDKIMHGIQLGSSGMHNQIKQWCENSYLSKLIEYLQKRSFDVWITSDHGNIECYGVGRPNEGATAESRGERVRVYPTQELNRKVRTLFPSAYDWQPMGLPDKYYPLIASGNGAFVKQGEMIVGHGGASIEEVIVPLINVKARKTYE